MIRLWQSAGGLAKFLAVAHFTLLGLISVLAIGGATASYLSGRGVGSGMLHSFGPFFLLDFLCVPLLLLIQFIADLFGGFPRNDGGNFAQLSLYFVVFWLGGTVQWFLVGYGITSLARAISRSLKS